MATPPNTLKPDLSSLRISDTKRTNPRSSKRWMWIVAGDPCSWHGFRRRLRLPQP